MEYPIVLMVKFVMNEIDKIMKIIAKIIAPVLLNKTTNICASIAPKIPPP